MCTLTSLLGRSSLGLTKAVGRGALDPQLPEEIQPGFFRYHAALADSRGNVSVITLTPITGKRREKGLIRVLPTDPPAGDTNRESASWATGRKGISAEGRARRRTQ